MTKRQNRPIPELEIPDYKKYLDWDDEDAERLMIPADILIDLIQRDPGVEEEDFNSISGAIKRTGTPSPNGLIDLISIP